MLSSIFHNQKALTFKFKKFPINYDLKFSWKLCHTISRTRVNIERSRSNDVQRLGFRFKILSAFCRSHLHYVVAMNNKSAELIVIKNPCDEQIYEYCLDRIESIWQSNFILWTNYKNASFWLIYKFCWKITLDNNFFLLTYWLFATFMNPHWKFPKINQRLC